MLSMRRAGLGICKARMGVARPKVGENGVDKYFVAQRLRAEVMRRDAEPVAGLGWFLSRRSLHFGMTRMTLIACPPAVGNNIAQPSQWTVQSDLTLISRRAQAWPGTLPEWYDDVVCSHAGVKLHGPKPLRVDRTCVDRSKVRL